MIQEGERVDQEIIVRHTHIVKQHKKFCNLANGSWVAAQNRDPVIPLVKEWMDRPRDDTRKLEEFLGDRVSEYDKRFYTARQQGIRDSGRPFVPEDNHPPQAKTRPRSLLSRQGNGKPLLTVATAVPDTKVGIVH